MEKKFFAAYRDEFEFRTSTGTDWTADDIWNEYTSGRYATGGSMKLFETLEEAADSLRGECRTDEVQGQIGKLLVGVLTYVEEQAWELDENGEPDSIIQGFDIPVINIAPYVDQNM